MKTKTVSSSNGGENSSRSAEKRSAEDETADLPTKPTKISKFGFPEHGGSWQSTNLVGSQMTKKVLSIELDLSKPRETFPTLTPKTILVAAA